MISSDRIARFRELTTVLDGCNPVDWDDIVRFLMEFKNNAKDSLTGHGKASLELFAEGAAFITYSYGIDGVSMEMAKYAHSLSGLLAPFGNPSIHFIGGKFQPLVSTIFSVEWQRFEMEGINGWSKWDEGKWFAALFRKEMRSGSKESNILVAEIYQQAVSIAKRLGKYFLDNRITLVVPVNVASNPGNIALTLGLVLVTEILGIYVLNSNHDFYWEAGKPQADRADGEGPGPRDHFFRNIKNKTFFSLFRLIYPWNGGRWLQININARQSRRLIEKFGFPEEKVFEISTYISDTFFANYSKTDVLDIRLRMGHILSDGEAIMHPRQIGAHLSILDGWMKNQRPIILGARPGLSIDPRSEDLIVLLQPTRIVGRKRIERNLELITALFQFPQFRAEFDEKPRRQLVLHITGPAPREHSDDVAKVLSAYKKTIRVLPDLLADRFFIAFSVGVETHASFLKNQYEPLTIEELYRMADVVVFPSETEGRGLPIIEAGACGVPIICSHYSPKEVFSDVTGENLSDELRIKYTLFPEGRFHHSFLSEVSRLLLHPGGRNDTILHNKKAVRARYSRAAFDHKFERLVKQLINVGQG